MKFKSKQSTSNKNVIMIKRSIEVDDFLKEFIFKNSNYRRKVWNDFVTEYYRCKNDGIKFNAMEFKTKYYNEVEKPNDVYKTYTTGISTQVMKDIINGIEKCRLNNGHLHYRKFDRFRCSFKVHTVAHYRDLSNGLLPRLESKIHVLSDDIISYSERVNKLIYIKLKEPLWTDALPINGKMVYFDKEIANARYAFSEEDIKEISFIHELGKFYICLAVRIFKVYDKKTEKYKRIKNAGIDLGIHNPICITDSDCTKILRMSTREINRIHYLERRIRRLQSIMDRKFLTNVKSGRNPYSKNYIKIQRKYRVTWYKIRNIRLNWRRHVSKLISTMYKTVCVDKSRTPTEKDHEIHIKSVLRKINSYNRLHGIYDFYRCLIHACNIYKTRYIESPEKTTCTCSICGHVNDHLPLSERNLICDNCHTIIDRDVNASKNCYNYILEL